ncbi:MAG TPA: flagellar basal body P-ring formation protein FlgA [Gammaproteobacteria bacterium]|nr:flagellar basal body P-ring formation protein FlgA [Gammaproteobacteria bacterium]
MSAVLRCVFVLVFVSGSGMARAHASSFELELRDKVLLQHRYYTLADVAVMRGADPALLKRLGRVRLGRVPRVGRLTRLDRTRIAQRLNRLIPGIRKYLGWRGAEFVEISSAQSELKKERYLGLAQAYLSDELGRKFIKHEIRPAGEYRTLYLPPGEVEMVPSRGSGGKIGKRTCVWLDISVSGEHYRTLPVWFDVAAFAEVLELQRDLPAGSVVDPRWVKRSVRDVANLRGTPLGVKDQLEGKRARRALSAGTVLVAEGIEPLPPVVKGQQVKVRSRAGNITLTLRARALEDGYPGDAIRLERLDGSDSYVAVVIGENLVAVGGARL